MKTFFKTILRCFKSNISRMIALTSIILLGIAFVSGLGTLSYTIDNSINQGLLSQNISDLVIKTDSESGFSDDEISSFLESSKVEKGVSYTSLDLTINEKNGRLIILPENGFTVNALAIEDGRLPDNKNEIVVERSSNVMTSPEINSVIDLDFSLSGYPLSYKDLEVVGLVGSPLIMAKDGELDLVNEEDLELIVYVHADLLSSLPLPKTDISLILKERNNYELGSDKYFEYVDKVVNEFKSTNSDSFHYLTLNENKSYKTMLSYQDKIDVIALIFPVFFILVAALVVLTTMTRLIEEERGIIGCYKTLGESDGRIYFKYIFFALVTGLLGCTIGLPLGLLVLPSVIYPAFNMLFFIPDFVLAFNCLEGVISIVFMMAVVILVTVYVVWKTLRVSASQLLLPKAPKPGGKILLEHIPLIWNRLSFKYKSTLRNIFRYKNHLIMTVISVAGSTALVFAGFSLQNVAAALETDSQFSSMSRTLNPIAYLVIVFALLLAVLVVFNLTNMNIGERVREIATLEVLGYHDKEVNGYIFREVVIMSLMGIVFGVPLGLGLMAFLLNYLDFGSVSDIKWYSYLLTIGSVLLFVFIVDFFLKPKIKGVDMNASLKSVE